ncbi:MAG: lysine exporter LysO family protein, partial [Bacteroidales bacterium]|nr:lysine exporter LysO family protein [Bacteroidales bacterium]
ILEAVALSGGAFGGAFGGASGEASGGVFGGKGLALADVMSVSSGFGYYSLSSILLNGARGAEIGTMALAANIIRELLTIVFAPLMVKFCGPLAPISAGGATTMDTTLPIIQRCCGNEFVPVSIFHGVVMDFSVPLFLTLFVSLS